MTVLSKVLSRESSHLADVIRALDQTGLEIAIVCDSRGKLLGVLSFGDIKRALHEGYQSNEKIGNLYNREPIFVKKGASVRAIKRLIHAKLNVVGGVIQVPVVNKQNLVVDIAYLDDSDSVEYLSKSTKKPVSFKNRILVTGGAGYLGSVLVRKLLANGFKVKVMDNLTFGKDSLSGIWAHRNFDLVVGNILNIEDVVNACHDVDTVVHLAALVGDDASSEDPVATISNNTLATINLANICKRFQINRFIFASSCSVYGASESEALLSERAPLFPVSLYAQSKIESEMELMKLRDNNFSPTILRFATLFGWSYRMRFDLVVNLFCAMAYFKKELVLRGGSQWRPFLHVEDAARAVISVLESPMSAVGGQIFNVGSSDSNYRISDVAEIVRRTIAGVSIKTKERDRDFRNYRVDFGKIGKIVGFTPTKSVEDGVLEIYKKIKNSNFDDLKKRAFNSPNFLKTFN